MIGGWRSRVVPERPGLLLASGVLLALSHPPFHLLVPPFVALVPFALWLEGVRVGPDEGRQARKGGFFFGLVYYPLVYYWLFVALVFYHPLAVLAFLAPVLILSGFLALFSGAMLAARRRLGWPVWLVLPVFWTANEWMRGNLPQVAFPWMQLGDSLTAYPWLIGAADLVGSRGLSFWLALVNGLVAAAILARRGPRAGGAAAAGGARMRSSRLPLLAGLTAALALPVGYSLLRWSTLELRPAARVGVVQPNVPEHLKINDRALATDSAMRATQTLVRPWLAGPERLDLLLLPESALHDHIDPIPSLRYGGRPDLEAWAGGLARGLDAAILYGGLGGRDLGSGSYEYFNSAFFAGPDGRRIGRYDKRFLVPIVERVPFVDPRWFSGFDYFGGFGVGPLVRPFELGGDAGSDVAVGSEVAAGPTPVSFGVLICYESIFTQLSRHYRRAGADFVVNITNDAWFGRDAWWSRTSALWQHPAHLVMRSVETRMGAARSANTGISGLVDPLGRVSEATSLFEPAAFTGDVMTTDVTTLYVRYGDTVGWAAMLVAVLGLAAAIREGRRLARAAPQPPEPDALG